MPIPARVTVRTLTSPQPGIQLDLDPEMLSFDEENDRVLVAWTLDGAETLAEHILRSVKRARQLESEVIDSSSE